MTNREKYNQVFMESFSINNDQLNDDLVYQSVQQWDSIGHMGMIADLEEAFDIMMDTDDIIDFGSYNKGIELLAKYDIII
jgi:acyl carrier protein